jgi:hypothetical protein
MSPLIVATSLLFPLSRQFYTYCSVNMGAIYMRGQLPTTFQIAFKRLLPIYPYSHPSDPSFAAVAASLAMTLIRIRPIAPTKVRMTVDRVVIPSSKAEDEREALSTSQIGSFSVRIFLNG